MSKKKGLYDRLNTSVADQNVRAKDKFENADLVVVRSKLKQQRTQQETSESDRVNDIDLATQAPAEIGHKSDPLP